MGSPRQADAQALDQATVMVERFHRMFLCTLRALQNLRRCAAPVLVQNAVQVNVGTQQVNMTASSDG